MFNMDILKDLRDSFDELNVENLKFIEINSEDVEGIFSYIGKNEVRSIEEFYALNVKKLCSYSGNADAKEDFFESLLDGDFEASSVANAIDSLSDWSIDLRLLISKVEEISPEAKTYVVEDKGGYSEFLFEDKERFCFVGVSI
ncbi:hypothetical protein [Pseudoteredinibacter isoporae]|uniref:hypothetical protein n=1 Tax=Pseudoteredinibacter isoporae TaxID=570281 RepID=UPI003105E7DE